MIARRRLGQHFLVDPHAVTRIVEALAPRRDEPVLEIGAGRGALTASLLERVDRLAAVELDADLATELRRKWEPSGLLVLHADILRTPLASVGPSLGLRATQPLAIAGNLPYYVSKPVADKLVSERAEVARAVLMFQSEVADRLTAAPGGKAYGPLSVLVGETYEIRSLFELPPRAFRPSPSVTSAVTLWRRRPLSALPPEVEPHLRACLAACFAMRRKTLRNNLRSCFRSETAADTLLHQAGVDGSRRPETISPGEYRRLAAAWPEDAPTLL